MAVALVAVAAKGLVLKTAKDSVTGCILLSSAALSIMFAAPWLFPALILGGGAVTLLQNTLAKRDMAMPVCLSAPCRLPDSSLLDACTFNSPPAKRLCPGSLRQSANMQSWCAPAQAAPADDGVASCGLSRVGGFLLLLFWAALLATALTLRALADYSNHYAQPLHWCAPVLSRIGAAQWCFRRLRHATCVA